MGCREKAWGYKDKTILLLLLLAVESVMFVLTLKDNPTISIGSDINSLVVASTLLFAVQFKAFLSFSLIYLVAVAVLLVSGKAKSVSVGVSRALNLLYFVALFFAIGFAVSSALMLLL